MFFIQTVMAETGSRERYHDYPLFKGLQRPLEFFGLQGRYIYWAAAAVGSAVVGFILSYIIVGFVTGLILLVLSLAVGAAIIVIRQRKGLHTKKDEHGIFIYRCSRRM